MTPLETRDCLRECLPGYSVNAKETPIGTWLVVIEGTQVSVMFHKDELRIYTKWDQISTSIICKDLFDLQDWAITYFDQ